MGRQHFGVFHPLEDEADRLIKESLQGVTSHKAKSDILTPWKEAERHRREVYCLYPDTRVLCSDLVWRELWQLDVGDEIVGFDEYPASDRQYREICVATVTQNDFVTLPSYRITMEDGREVIASEDHLWLCRHRSASLQSHPGWVAAKDLEPGAKIYDLGEPWQTLETREAGYLAGVYDGEGWLKPTVGFCQKPGVVLDMVEKYVKELGFETMEHRMHDSGVVYFNIAGGLYQHLKFLGQIQPHRLIAKVPSFLEHKTLLGMGHLEVAQVKFIGDQQLKAIATSTSTLIAEGMLSHNTQQGFPDEAVRKGMFGRVANRGRPDLNSRDGLARANRFSSTLSAFVEENGAVPDHDG